MAPREGNPLAEHESLTQPKWVGAVHDMAIAARGPYPRESRRQGSSISLGPADAERDAPEPRLTNS